jgi:hypothetical protein
MWVKDPVLREFEIHTNNPSVNSIQKLGIVISQPSDWG